MSAPVKDVLLIGAGRRMHNGVIPALNCLSDRFRIAAVASRTPRDITVGGFSTRTRLLEGIDLSGIALAIVAVPAKQVPRVLDVLTRQNTQHLVLMVDTPVLNTTGLMSVRQFHKFKRVLAPEDTIALPSFRAARRLIESGAIGRLRRIFMFHNDYKYHVYAGLKMLAGARSIVSIRDRKFGKTRQKTLALDNGVVGVMYEPRDRAGGRFLVEGERGLIADYEHAGVNVHRLDYITEGPAEAPIYRGLTVDGVAVPQAHFDAAYLAGVGTDVADATLLNTLKLRGLIDLLDAALQDSSPFHYDVIEALGDGLASRWVDRLGWVPPGTIERLLRRL